MSNPDDTVGGALTPADLGIRVNPVAVAIIATAFARGAEVVERAVAENEIPIPVPYGRAGRQEDVAGLAVFSAFEDSTYGTISLLHLGGLKTSKLRGTA